MRKTRCTHFVIGVTEVAFNRHVHSEGSPLSVPIAHPIRNCPVGVWNLGTGTPDVHLIGIFRHLADYTDYTDNSAPENPRGITTRTELRA